MFDVDKFIELIKDHPCLWDKKIEDYSNKTCRDKAWLEIGEAFYDGWSELDLKMKDVKGKEMKKKWKNIKDNFFKYMNEGKSGASAPKKKKYVYAEALNFLLASIDKRETSGNIIEEIKDIPFDDNETVLDSPQLQPQASPQAPPQPGVPKPCYTKKNQKFTPFQSQLLQKLDNENSKQDDNDPDRLFLLSLLADYKTMSDDDKFEFKINSLWFIREANNRRQMGNTTPSSFPFRSQFSQQENSSQCLQPLLNRSDALQFSVVSPQGSSSSSVYSEYQTEYQYICNCLSLTEN